MVTHCWGHTKVFLRDGWATSPQGWEWGRVKWRSLCMSIRNLRETPPYSNLVVTFFSSSYFSICHLNGSLTNMEKAVGQDERGKKTFIQNQCWTS